MITKTVYIYIFYLTVNDPLVIGSKIPKFYIIDLDK